MVWQEKMLLIYLICYLLALFISMCIGIAFFTNPHVYNMSNTNKILLVCISTYCTIALIILPQLYKHGVITADYHNSDRTERAKTRFIFTTIFMPFWLYLFIGSFFIFEPNRLKITIGIFLIFILKYVHDIFILKKMK